MTRLEYDASQALVPGTWQNRQGRAEEWHAASARSTWFAVVVTLVGAMSFVALCAVAGCQFAVWGAR